MRGAGHESEAEEQDICMHGSLESIKICFDRVQDRASGRLYFLIPRILLARNHYCSLAALTSYSRGPYATPDDPLAYSRSWRTEIAISRLMHSHDRQASNSRVSNASYTEANRAARMSILLSFVVLVCRTVYDRIPIHQTRRCRGFVRGVLTGPA